MDEKQNAFLVATQKLAERERLQDRDSQPPSPTGSTTVVKHGKVWVDTGSMCDAAVRGMAQPIDCEARRPIPGVRSLSQPPLTREQSGIPGHSRM